jgi:hypothetical protein
VAEELQALPEQRRIAFRLIDVDGMDAAAHHGNLARNGPRPRAPCAEAAPRSTGGVCERDRHTRRARG